jgi:ribosome-associated protein
MVVALLRSAFIVEQAGTSSLSAHAFRASGRPTPSDVSDDQPASSHASEDRLVVNERVAIPRSELVYRATRSGGAGGQHVNTSSTRIELLWNFARSRALDDASRARIAEKLAARLDADGNVRVVASDRRSQQQNREAADQRLAELVRRALVVPKARKRTKPPRAAKEKRLAEKRHRAERKRQRRPDVD